jgi:hypothetical protein
VTAAYQALIRQHLSISTTSFWMTVLLNLAGVAFVVHKGWARVLSETLFGP